MPVWQISFGETPKPTTTKFGVKNPQTLGHRTSYGANPISIPQAILVWLTSVTDGQTDRHTDEIAMAIATSYDLC